MFNFVRQLFPHRAGNPHVAELPVALPTGVRFVAKDRDGSWYGYPFPPHYDQLDGTFYPDARYGEPLSAFLCWGTPARDTRDTAHQVRT